MASTDDADTNRRFAEANEATFPVLADPEKVTARAYGVLTMNLFASRTTFYIDPAGKILWVDDEVRPFLAGKDMAARLTALGVPKPP
jgi:peroxiredoxin Q/BCP